VEASSALAAASQPVSRNPLARNPITRERFEKSIYQALFQKGCRYGVSQPDVAFIIHIDAQVNKTSRSLADERGQ
jgi:hypothetical protein